ncbi:MAG: hypothetical protein J6S71_02525, partial [Clostridia bacterium]|nr:hypothetical protein [Clostridia bacterium]
CLNLKFGGKSEDEGWNNICVCNWGEDYATSFPGSDEDLLHLVDTFPADKEKPRLYIACGTEDFLYKQNITFKNYLEGKGFDFLYEEGPGAHTWDFWDKWIVPAIEFLFAEIKK